MRKEAFHKNCWLGGAIRIWLMSLLITVITAVLSWLVIEYCPDGSLVVIFCVVAALFAVAICVHKVMKAGIGRWWSVIIVCISPSTLYFLFVLSMIYVIFFADWSMKIGY